MNKHYGSYTDSNKRCHEFAVTHRPTNASKKFDEYIKSLGGSIEAISEASSQLSRSPISKTRQDLRGTRTSLREYHTRLQRIAHTLNFENPGAATLFRFPKENARLQTEIDVGKNILKGAKQYEAFFVEHGMPADFLKQLENTIKAVETAQAAVNGLRRVRAQAKEAREQAYQIGRKAKSGLNGIFHVLLAKDAEKLAAWQAACEVEYRKNPKRKETIPTTEEVKEAA